MAFLRRDIDLVEIQAAYKVDAQSTSFFEKVVAVLVKRSDRDERLEQLSIRVMLSGPTSRTASPTKVIRQHRKQLIFTPSKVCDDSLRKDFAALYSISPTRLTSL